MGSNTKLIVSSLGFGGTETFVIKLANYLVDDFVDKVELHCFSDDIRRSNLLNSNVKLITYENKFQKAFAVFSLMFSKKVNVFGVDLWPYFILNFHARFYERTDFRYYNGRGLVHRGLIFLIRKFFFKRIVFQSQSFLKTFNIHYGVTASLVLHNFWKGRFKNTKLNINRIENVIWVGRFSKEKNPLFLLEQPTIKFLVGRRLHIFGDGPLKVTVINSLIANDVVYFDYGIVENPLSAKWNNSVLIIPSLFEGVPNVFLEALDNGIPVFVNSDLIGCEDYINTNNYSLQNLICSKFPYEYVIKNISINKDEINKLF